MHRIVTYKWKVPDSFYFINSSCKGGYNMIIKKCYIDSNIEFSCLGKYGLHEPFYFSWKDNLAKVLKQSSEYTFGNEIKEQIEWVMKNSILCRPELFDKQYSLLSHDSRQLIKKAMDRHEEQFKILSLNCKNYEGFVDLVRFLQDLPHRVLEITEKIKAREKRKKENTYELSVQLEEIDAIYDIMQEKTYKMTKEDTEISRCLLFFY